MPIEIKFPVDLGKIIEISDPKFRAEGTYGVIKRAREYKRVGRGLKSVIFEFTACLAFNLYKYYLKKQKSLLST